jgi:hypothetical protein
MARKSRCGTALLLLFLAFSVSGCELLGDIDSLLSIGKDPNGPDSVTDTEEVLYAPTVFAKDNPSIKAKFGIEVTGTKGVTAAFYELHAYSAAGGLADQNNVIRLGDWIDLEDGLKVDAYGEGDATGGFEVANTAITPSPLPSGYGNKLLRLIVVGINSFKGKNGNDDTPHVVFHFKNVPIMRRMNSTKTNAGGYPASEMRKYLLDGPKRWQNQFP